MGSETFKYLPSHHFHLPNLLDVIFLPIDYIDVMAIQVWVKTGSIYEGKFLGSGISHFVEHMVFKGTNRRTYADIFKETQRLGAKLNAYTSFDRTVYTYDGCVNSFEEGIDILSDMLCCSTFPEGELMKERDVILREIDMCNDDPDDRLSQLLFESAFQKHPYRYPVIGIRSIFEQLTRSDLVEYWKSRYAVNNMTLVVAGKLDVAEVREKVDRYFGQFQPRCLAPVYVPREPFQLAARCNFEYGEYQLTRGAVAFKIPGIGHKDAAKLQVLANALGGGESSILYQRLREQLHLVYTIDASSWMAEGHGLFWIQYTCLPENHSQVETLLQKHICEWTEDFLIDADVQKAYNQAVVAELDARKTVSGQAHHTGWATVCLGDENYPKHYLAQLGRLSARDIKDVAHKYFKDVACTRVCLAPTEANKDKYSGTKVIEKEKPVINEVVVDGVRVLIQQCVDFPKTNVQVLFSAGALYEPTNKRGLTQLLATLLTKDTQRQSAAEIAQEIEKLGGQFNGFSGNNHLGLSVEVLSKDLLTALNLLKNAIACPQFSEISFDNEKSAQLAELKEMQDDVFFVGFQKIRQQFFQNHPYNVGQLGQAETIAAISREDCVRFYNERIRKANCVVSVCTSLPVKEVLDDLKPLCAALKAGDGVKKSDLIDFTSVHTVTSKLKKEQAMVFKAYPIAGLAHDDFYVGEFLEELFNGLSSSFVEEVREKRGLAYTVGATRLMGEKCGMFCLFAGTLADQVKAVEEEMQKAIRRILDKQITVEEFNICRACLKVNHQLRLQTLGRRAFQAGYDCLLHLPCDRWLNYERQIDAMTLDQFYNTCRKYLQEDVSSFLSLIPE